jgi:hypothetical protein
MREAAGEWRGPDFWGCMTGCTPDGALVTWRTGLALVRASSEARLVLLAGMAAVQHGSTATHLDAGGLAGTRKDGDLHGWTRVDVLPPDGMQEVSGSSPLSSTGQKPNSNESNSEYSSKVQQRRPGGPPYVCSDRAPPLPGAAGRTPGPGAESALASLSPGQIPVPSVPRLLLPDHHPALLESPSRQ